MAEFKIKLYFCQCFKIMVTMENYNDLYGVCCSEDRVGLSYPGFSAVFIHTFSLHHNQEFCLPVHPNGTTGQFFISEMPLDIETQIFHLKERDAGFYGNVSYRAHPLVKASADEDWLIYPSKVSAVLGRGMEPVRSYAGTDVCRFKFDGFSFNVTFETRTPVSETEYKSRKVTLKGRAFVEMSLFFGHTVSMTYRFLFNNEKEFASILDADGNFTEAETNHLIGFLSTFLGAEYWSGLAPDDYTDKNGTNINFVVDLEVSDLHLDEDGNYVDAAQNLIMHHENKAFDKIALRYKKFILRKCAPFMSSVPVSKRAKYFERGMLADVHSDSHYAMVDIWENVRHVDTRNGFDLFGSDEVDVERDGIVAKEKKHRLTEAETINHIRDYHKPELIGLMTMYPGEWPYRDASAYPDVCGVDIAIDTDDLVLAGTNMALVIGTYGRRGSSESTDGVVDEVNWMKHLEDRRKYHVSWPEYLMIVQMILAKKYRLCLAKEQLIEMSLNTAKVSPSVLIGDNARLGIRLSRMILQLDVIKYSKFASHIHMFNQTAARLELDETVKDLKDLMEIVDSSLHNLSDYSALKSDFMLNLLLGIISVVSSLSILYEEHSEGFPLIEKWFFSKNPSLQTGLMAEVLTTIIMTVVIFAVLFMLKDTIKKLWDRFIKNRRYL